MRTKRAVADSVTHTGSSKLNENMYDIRCYADAVLCYVSENFASVSVSVCDVNSRFPEMLRCTLLDSPRQICTHNNMWNALHVISEQTIIRYTKPFTMSHIFGNVIIDVI